MKKLSMPKLIVGGLLIISTFWMGSVFGLVQCSFENPAKDAAPVFAFRVTESQKQEITSIAKSFEQGDMSYEFLRNRIKEISDESGFSIVLAQGDSPKSLSICRQGDSCFVSFAKGYLYLKFYKVSLHNDVVITNEDRVD